MKILNLMFFAALLYACETGPATSSQDGAQPAATPTPSDTAASAQKAPEFLGPPEREGDQPKTVRDFFNLLPEKYFTLEGCDRETDRDCKKARAEYLKSFTQVEDIPNGYFKGACDGAQACIEMTIFKRPDGTYLVGVATEFEMGSNFYFLDYAGGKWEDVSASVVPEYSKKNWYELPRHGTTMKVYAKKIIERGDDFEASERGKLLYSLAWKGEKFEKQK
jgi:hypothetical protein